MKRVAAGAPVFLLPAVYIAATWNVEPRWSVMWGLAFVVFCGCKWLTWSVTPAPHSSAARKSGYVFAWPGMDAPAFLGVSSRGDGARPSPGEWLFAGVKLAFGLAMFFGVARLVPADQPYLVGWVGMIGVAFILHFGVFHLLSCAWRSVGVDARPLMNWPVLATSLADYWGRRWNTAFRDLTHRFLFRPLTPRIGARGALVVGFIASGLVHDLVISCPAQAGYGRPTLFFLLQVAGMLFERSALGVRLGVGSGVRGWLFTMFVLLAPALLLFHAPFVTGVVVPFMRAWGAIP